MGRLNGRRLEKLEDHLDIPKTEAEREEKRRKAEVRERVNEDLRALEARRRSMSPEELEAWRNSPEGLALKAQLDAWGRERRGRSKPDSI